MHHPTLEGFGEFALLFTLIWIAWSNFTWSVNAVAGNSRLVRAVFMVATAIHQYLLFTFAAIVLLLVGAVSSGPWQIGLWVGPVAVLLLNTINAGNNDWLVRQGTLPNVTA